MKKVLAWVTIWFACAVAALWSLVAMPVNAVFGSGQKSWRLAISFDQLGNVAAGGDEDETFSSRCWRNRHRQPYQSLRRGLDTVFRWLTGDETHCRSAMRPNASKLDLLTLTEHHSFININGKYPVTLSMHKKKTIGS